jgi:TolB-like protein/Tfp pilus assembly protein PilF
VAEVRRLAAILAADVVGYSRMMGEDEAGTARAVRERREAAAPIVAAHGGRLFKTMGDGMLIEFPSIVSAVECALAMQGQMAERNAERGEGKSVLYRIGVHVGDVLIEGDDVLGDGVNIAARLEAVAEPGGVCVSAAAFDHVRGRIEAGFVDLGEKALKNIARPVRVYAVAPAREPPAAAGRTGAPRLSIVVLPFANIGGGPEQDYFVDGVTESLTTDLSRVRGAFVIARNTAFAYKGKTVDVREIGRDLNVRFALEGSVQRSGDRMRVNVQLIDAETGAHLWAERFDKKVADLFDMQDEIVSRLANQLAAEIFSAEARRAERASDPDALDLVLQGAAWLNKGPTSENLAKARGFFGRALALDRENVGALVMTALVDFLVATYLFPDDRSARLAAAEAAATRALSLAPEYALAHMVRGTIVGALNRPELAIAECERALAIDRNLATAHATIGIFKVSLGHAEETEAHVLEALRLSPRDSNASYWLLFVGVSKMLLGRNEEAAAWLRRSIEASRNNPIAHFNLAAALALLGRDDEAQAAAREGLALSPQFTVARAESALQQRVFAYPATYPASLEGLRRAGVPER